MRLKNTLILIATRTSILILIVKGTISFQRGDPQDWQADLTLTSILTPTKSNTQTSTSRHGLITTCLFPLWCLHSVPWFLPHKFCKCTSDKGATRGLTESVTKNWQLTRQPTSPCTTLIRSSAPSLCLRKVSHGRVFCSVYYCRLSRFCYKPPWLTRRTTKLACLGRTAWFSCLPC